ncbi:MAG TPA: MFS transporter [Nocardioidaceae bacterium]|nr:MFS transporter [Nocardioidaceae bacterium]
MRASRASSNGLLLFAVLLVALNLRGAIAAVAPVLPEISADLSLSAGAAGLLTSLPVLCFAAASPGSAWLARRTGLENAVLLGFLALAAATVLRTLDGISVLLAGTLAVGVAMAVGNVVVPVVIKRDFPLRAGRVTGLYTAALAGGAALAAALTAPIAAAWGWQVGLSVWSAFVLVAAGVWWLATRDLRATAARRRADSGVGRELRRPGARVWRNQTAWAVTLFLGCQSFAYFSVTAWLPTLLVDQAGLDIATASLGMSLFQLLGIPGTLLIPLLAGWRPQQVWLGVSVACCWCTAVTGLLVVPSAWFAWTLLAGVAQGAGISFAFTVLVLRAHDTAAAHDLSSMAQLVGYALGAAGPAVVGALYQSTGGWTVPLGVLVAATILLAAFAFVAGRNTTVGQGADG